LLLLQIELVTKAESGQAAEILFPCYVLRAGANQRQKEPGQESTVTANGNANFPRLPRLRLRPQNLLAQLWSSSASS